MKYDNFILKCSVDIKTFFMPVLQKGFFIQSQTGVTVYSFLTEYCAIKDEYISEKIKTILVDGGPVDDIFNTSIKDRSTCALSGAMPGIVGAMMRIGSPYAAMRDSITVKPDAARESQNDILVELKLFNVILAELGSGFLERGILFDGKSFLDLFTRHGDEIYSCCREIQVNGTVIDVRGITEHIRNSDDILMLKLEIDNENKS